MKRRGPKKKAMEKRVISKSAASHERLLSNFYSRENIRRRMENSKLSQVQHWTVAAKLARYKTDKLGKLHYITQRALERYFQKYMGRAPEEWLNEQRMIIARRLIMERPTAKEVAYEL